MNWVDHIGRVPKDGCPCFHCEGLREDARRKRRLRERAPVREDEE